ncbi:MAG: Rrf2 family transcriptional regulator [Candidatus Krumholzibacteria bacterium]|nr:Rrf2 family transcriptional regulator [Candidatus Krumholzibacteria bacterium]
MLTRTGTHAVRAIVLLAGLPAGEYRGAQAVAATTGAPANYLGKLLQQLSRRGLVASQKGVGGGFRLARDAREITLHEVLEAVEDVGRWSNCMMGRAECSSEQPCAVHDQWAAVRDAYLDLLRRTRIIDLVDGAPGVPGQR